MLFSLYWDEVVCIVISASFELKIKKVKENVSMETESRSEFLDTGKAMRGGNGKRHGPSVIKVEPFVPRSEHNPKELRSWAKRTGFVSDCSGEAGTSASEKFDSVGFDVEKSFDDHRGGEGSSPKIEIDPVLGLARPIRDNEIEPDSGSMHGAMRSENGRVLRPKGARDGTVGTQNRRRRNGDDPALALAADDDDKKVEFRGKGDGNGMVNMNWDRSGHGVSAVAPVPEQKKEDGAADGDVKVNLYPEGEEEHADRGWQGPSGLKYGLTENPGLGQFEFIILFLTLLASYKHNS